MNKNLDLYNLDLYRKAADKAFLSVVVAINSYINGKLGITPKSHTERRSMLRKNG